MALTSAEVETWYRQHGAQVLRRARAILGSDALAQEALQEVFIRVIRSAADFRAAASPTTFLYRVTTNYCLNELRRERPRPIGLLSLDAVEGSRSEQCVLLRELLGQADEREAQAAVYVFVDQMTYDEAAALLGVSRRTVGNLVERFSRKARQALRDEPGALRPAEVTG